MKTIILNLYKLPSTTLVKCQESLVLILKTSCLAQNVVYLNLHLSKSYGIEFLRRGGVKSIHDGETDQKSDVRVEFVKS